MQNGLATRKIWNNIKPTDICIIGVSDIEEREKRAENLFKEIITENFPIVGKGTDFQFQDAWTDLN